MSPAIDRGRAYLDLLVATMPELAHVPVEEDADPDFVLRLPGGPVGIEVVTYMPATSPGEAAALDQVVLRERVMSRARRCYEQSGGPPLYVHVTFADDVMVSHARVSALAVELAEQLAREGSSIPQYSEDDPRCGAVPIASAELAAVHASRVPHPDYAAWVIGAGGWVWRAQREDLARVVARKEPMVPGYRRRCARLWLVIAFDAPAADGAIQPPARPVEFALSTGFDRVFCASRVAGEVVEVPVAGVHTVTSTI